MIDKHNPYGLPPVPPPNPYAGYAPPPGPVFNQNPYAPPSAAAQGPAWAQSFGLTQELASPGTRLVAKMLDGLLYLGALLVFVLPLAAFVGESIAVSLGSLAWLGLGIYQWHLISTTGQSLGKKWMGVRIVKVDGTPVDFVSGVVMRIWALYGLTVLGSFVFLGSLLPLVDALMIFTDERRCLHDQFAGTKVVVG